MALQRVAFHVTDRCQLNCDHCLRDPGRQPADLELGLITSVLDQARALYGANHVALTGGEPTLHPQFFEIVDAIAERGYTWHMVSNGHRFDRVAQRLAAKPGRLESLELMNFSLDGASEATHDSIREQGNFREVLQAVSICKMRGIKFLLQMTLHARNVDEIEAMALLAAQLGADRMAYHFAQPTGTFLDASMHLPASEWKRTVDRINRARETFKVPILHSETGSDERPFKLCEMWRHEALHVDPHGRLNLCCQHAGVPSEGPISDVAGDLRTMTLAEAHARFTEIVNHTVKARLQALESGTLDEWGRDFSCNWCLGHFGKPHWNEQGVAGPAAERARWRGGWQPGYKPSHGPARAALRLPLLDPDRAE
jgi:MoaA/NifB/PqqE/SkfB family radical SAM enzyme